MVVVKTQLQIIMLSMTLIHDVWGKADTVNSVSIRTTCNNLLVCQLSSGPPGCGKLV